MPAPRAADLAALKDEIEAFKAERAARQPPPEHIRRRRADVNVWCTDFSGESQGAYHRRLQELAASQRYLIVEGPPEVGKSQQLVLRRTLWRIGRDPEITIGIVGAKAEQAAEWVTAIRSGVESEKFRETFPAVTPADPWTTTRLRVRRRSLTNPAPTVQGIGVGGQFLGARLKLIVLDDVLNAINTATKEQRQKTLDWILSSMCVGRLVEGGQLILIGNTWTSDDAIHVLSKMVDAQGRSVYHYQRDALPKDPDAPDAVSPVPEIWPIERCRERKDVVGPSKWTWQYSCEPRGVEDSRFKPEWFETPSPKVWSPPNPAIPGLLSVYDAALAAGNTERADAALADLAACASYRPGPGEVVAIGMDIGVGLQEKHDQSAWCVLLRDARQVRHVLYVEKARKTGPDLIQRMRALEWAFPGLIFRVETVAAQRHLAQFAQQKVRAPIAYHSTVGTGETITSKAWGMEQLAARTGAGQILIANDAQGRRPRAADELIQGLLWYTPREHTADEVMALLLAEMQLVSIPSLAEKVRMAGDSHFDLGPSEGSRIYHGQA